MIEGKVLVTGATGYIAQRLVPQLLIRGYHVRCMARHPEWLRSRKWYSQVEVVQGDVTLAASLNPALQGVHSAYYLIHNMTSGTGYTEREQVGARNFSAAAAQAGLRRILYLGGLAQPGGEIGTHMRSRIATGETLRQGKVPVTELRAGIIVGPGSISFEMIRFMTELMPVIFGPPWLGNRAQPIAVQNVVDYLLEALERPEGQGRVYEIGGPDVMSYADLMVTYGRLRGLKRQRVIMAGIPLWFMALGVGWMTPVPAVIATPLVDGMRSESIVRDDSARREFPAVRLVGYEQAVLSTLDQLHPERVEPVFQAERKPVTSIKHEGFFIDHRWVHSSAPPGRVFRVVCALGGAPGWLFANWSWKLRGWLDRMLGGPGLRGRPPVLKVGEAVDFYRVEALERARLLLKAELKAPGLGWMEWRVEPATGGGTVLTQTGYFAPRGLPGFAYWYLLAPVHRWVFGGLIRAIARASEA